MISLISESAQAAEVAKESAWDEIRCQTNILLYAAPSVLPSKPKKPMQSGDDEKRRKQRKQPDEKADRNQKKTAAGRLRLLRQAFE